MGVYIKGMEMPRGCDECYIRERDTCPLRKVNVDEWGRLIDCPLIELPDHGDLIDRDAVMTKMYCSDAVTRNGFYSPVRIVFVRDIESAEVVIPAERSEDPSHPFTDSVMMGGKE